MIPQVLPWANTVLRQACILRIVFEAKRGENELKSFKHYTEILPDLERWKAG